MSIRTEPRFPPVTGETLTGRTLDLPTDFEAPLNLVLVAFRREHQPDVESWLSLASELEAATPGLRFYELPVISHRFALAKQVIDGGMCASVPDEDTRERTVTLYTDKATVRRALDIDDEDEIHAFLVDREGSIYWRSAGPRTDDAAEHLRETVASLS